MPTHPEHGSAEILESAAYVRGRRDGQTYISPAACPFPSGSVEAEHWRMGQLSALADAYRYAEAQTRKDLDRPWQDRDEHDINPRTGTCG